MALGERQTTVPKPDALTALMDKLDVVLQKETYLNTKAKKEDDISRVPTVLRKVRRTIAQVEALRDVAEILHAEEDKDMKKEPKDDEEDPDEQKENGENGSRPPRKRERRRLTMGARSALLSTSVRTFAR